MTTPSPSPPISLSPPSAGECLARCTAPPAHSSPPPVPSPLLLSSRCPTQIQTLRIASTQALIDAVTAALPSRPLPPLPPSLYIPPPVDHKGYNPRVLSSHRRKGLCVSTLGSRYMLKARQSIGISGGLGMVLMDTLVDPAGGLVCLTRDASEKSRSRICTASRYGLEAGRLLIGDSMNLQETATHQELQTHRDHVYAHETHLQAHQTQLQLHGTLIQTQHQVRWRQAQMVEIVIPPPSTNKPEGTELVIPPPSTDITIRARITIWP
ncbi:hypothetical protein Tco_0321942 [Tanacetum coccineum]